MDYKKDQSVYCPGCTEQCPMIIEEKPHPGKKNQTIKFIACDKGYGILRLTPDFERALDMINEELSNERT